MAAAASLRRSETIALTATFLAPVIGGYILHYVRSLLSRPEAGLISSFNISLYVLAAEIRPLSAIIGIIRSHTSNIIRKLPKRTNHATMQTLSTRMDAMEKIIREDLLASKADTEASVADDTEFVTAEVRREIQPDLEALNRAVRRYEKKEAVHRATIEERMAVLEQRLVQIQRHPLHSRRDLLDTRRTPSSSSIKSSSRLLTLFFLPLYFLTWLIPSRLTRPKSSSQ